MRKDFFGIAATMLLVGTMAFTSCSDDCVFGYDEEWDDMIPRTKLDIITDTGQSPIPDANPQYYNGWNDLPNQCVLKALAKSRGLSTNQLKIDDYKKLVAELMGESSWNQAIQDAYAADIRDSQSPGLTRTDSFINSIFGFSSSKIYVPGYYFGLSSITYSKACGERTLNGCPHMDYITKYRPAGGYGFSSHNAEFKTEDYGWVDVSEYTYLYH